MDKNQNRSSMRKRILEKNNTPKAHKSKRISFSDKKSFRVLPGDATSTKEYDNSFELSDHVSNVSGENDNIGYKIVDVNQRRISLRSRVVAPETKTVKQQPKTVTLGVSNAANKLNKKVAQAQLETIEDESIQISAIEQRKRMLSTSYNTTMDFINKTNDTRLSMNYTVDTSLDEEFRTGAVAIAKRYSEPTASYINQRPSFSFSLGEYELNLSEHGKSLSNQNAQLSFSHEERELKNFQNAKKNPCAADCVEIELSKINELGKEPSKNNCLGRKTTIIAENIDESSLPNQSDLDIPIHMDEIDKNLRRKTITDQCAMDMSWTTIQNKKNSPNDQVRKTIKQLDEIDTNFRRKTINDQCVMDMSKTTILNKENSPNDQGRKTIKHLDEIDKTTERKTTTDQGIMDMSMTSIPNKEIFSNDLRWNTTKHMDEMDKNLRRKTITERCTMDMSGISIISNENIFNDVRRKTIEHVESMELSRIDQNKENILPNAVKATDINDFVDCDLTNVFDKESLLPNLNRKKSADINDFVDCDLTNVFDKENILPNLNIRQFADINDIVDCDLTNVFDKENAFPNLNAKKSTEVNDFVDYDLSKIIDKNQDVKMDVSKSYESQNIESEELKIIKNNTGHSSKVSINENSSGKDFSKIFDKNEEVKMDISKSYDSHNIKPEELKIIKYNTSHSFKVSINENISEKEPETNMDLAATDKNGAIPKVVVVRKTCVTKSVADLQLELFKRYQNHHEKNNVHATKANFTKSLNESHTKLSSSTAENSFLSPESHSILPPSYQQNGSIKKINFRQLNEEIESGKIQVFPQAKQNSKKSSFKRETILHPIDMLEESLKEYEAESKSQIAPKLDLPTGPVNINSQLHEDTFDMKLKEARTITRNNNIDLTPPTNTVDQKELILRLCERTLHASDIEFEYDEKQCKNTPKILKEKRTEQNAEIVNRNEKMTSSRRLTQFYDDFDVEESFISTTKQNKGKVIKDCEKASQYYIGSNIKISNQRNTIYDNKDLDIDETISNEFQKKEEKQADACDKNLELNTCGITTEGVSQYSDFRVAIPELMEVENNSLIYSESPCRTKDCSNILPSNNVNISMDLSMECSAPQPQMGMISNIKVLEKHSPEKIDLSSPPSKLLTRIPILIGSAKKENSVLSRFLSPQKSNLSQINQTIENPRHIVPNCFEHSVFIMDPPIAMKNEQTFEDPITVSDVSAFYIAEKQKQNDTVKDYKIFNEREEDTQTKIKLLKKQFVDLNFDSSVQVSETDVIDDTRISLVGSILDEEDTEDNDIVQILSVTNNTSKDMKNTAVRHSLCRKCKNCENTIKREETFDATNSFVLPEMPEMFDLSPLMNRLDRLRAKPTLEETDEYWRRELLASDMCENSDNNEEDETEKEDEIDIKIKEHEERIKRLDEVIETRERMWNKWIERKPFYERWQLRLSKHLPDWIFNYLTVINGFCQFDHKWIITFSLIATFEPKDPLRKDVTLKCIQLQPSQEVPSTRWKPIDFVLDFQLKLELPYNLNELYRFDSDADDAMFNVLEKIDKICVSVYELGMLFWKTISKERAVLVRGSHNTYIKKIIRKLIPPNDKTKYSQIQSIEFKIEVMNIRKICFKDILTPPLHMFHENIENLPIGLEFLRVFLRDPVRHLKE